MNIRQFFVVLFVLALMGLGVRYVLNRYRDAELVHLQFRSPGGQLTEMFRLEPARNNSARTKGLMFRKSLPENGGMFFAFPREEVHSFWMKNTYVSLDMIFLDADLKVVGILSDVPVLSQEQRSVKAKSQYVVELAAGSATKHGIGEGWVAVVKGQVPRGVE